MVSLSWYIHKAVAFITTAGKKECTSDVILESEATIVMAMSIPYFQII